MKFEYINMSVYSTYLKIRKVPQMVSASYSDPSVIVDDVYVMRIENVDLNGLFICRACFNEELDTIFVINGKYRYSDRSFYENLIESYLVVLRELRGLK